MPAATSRLALPYPIPDDSVDVPRDVQALATKLDGICQTWGCHTPVRAARSLASPLPVTVSAFPQMLGATGTKNPTIRDVPAGALSGCVYTVPVAGVWRIGLHLRFDNQAGGRYAYGRHVFNGSPSSSWNLVWVYGAVAGSYVQGMGFRRFLYLLPRLRARLAGRRQSARARAAGLRRSLGRSSL
jgi:hypothetical protein